MKIIKRSSLPKILVITERGNGVTDEGAAHIAADVPFMTGLVTGKLLLDKKISLAYIEQHKIAMVCLLTIEDGCSVRNNFPAEAVPEICQELKEAGEEETTWQVLKRMLDEDQANKQ